MIVASQTFLFVEFTMMDNGLSRTFSAMIFLLSNTRLAATVGCLKPSLSWKRPLAFGRADGISAQLIRCYLHRWCRWWSAFAEDWTIDTLLEQFLIVNRHLSAAEIAHALRLQNQLKIKMGLGLD